MNVRVSAICSIYADVGIISRRYKMLIYILSEVFSADNDNIQLFEDPCMRTNWNEETEEWLSSITNEVGVLTGQQTLRNASRYWAVMKNVLSRKVPINCLQIISS